MPRTSEDAFSPHVSRRKALGTMGLGSLAMIVATSPASAFFFGSSKRIQLDLSDYPSTWVRMQGSNLQGYANYLASLRLKHVKVKQVISAHAKRRGSVWNMLPPKSMWKNMGPTLKAVDKVAMQLGAPVREVVSAYRSPAYNARCAGASRGSWHKANVAVDVKFPVRASSVASVARSMRSRGYFRGGVGRYYSFTHIDTRGHNVDW